MCDLKCNGPAHSARYRIEMEGVFIERTHESNTHPWLPKLCQDSQQLHHLQGPDCVFLWTEDQKLRQTSLDSHVGEEAGPGGLQLSPHLWPHLVCDSSIISLCYQAWLSSKWFLATHGALQVHCESTRKRCWDSVLNLWKAGGGAVNKEVDVNEGSRWWTMQ